MFALLIGVGALFLAVFVSAILDPRWSHIRGAGEHTRAAAGSDYMVDEIMWKRTARRWRWDSLRPVIAQRRPAFTASGASVLCRATA
jgi:hypothetical protein